MKVHQSYDQLVKVHVINKVKKRRKLYTVMTLRHQVTGEHLVGIPQELVQERVCLWCLWILVRLGWEWYFVGEEWHGVGV